MTARVLKNNPSCEPFIFASFATGTVEKLKEARRMYMMHKQHNHTESRESNLKYWGDECLSLRGKLK